MGPILWELLYHLKLLSIYSKYRFRIDLRRNQDRINFFTYNYLRTPTLKQNNRTAQPDRANQPNRLTDQTP